MPVLLRYYQEEAVSRTLDAFRTRRAGSPELPLVAGADVVARQPFAGLMCLATGTGKTLTASDLIRQLGVGKDGRTVLWVTHQDKLLAQAEEALLEQIPGVSLGYEIGALHAKHEAQIILASIQSLRGARATRLLNRLKDRLVLLVIDEAHRSAAPTYRALIHSVKTGCPRSNILGLTATPNRTDKVTLADLYDDITSSYLTRDAIFDGWLVLPRGYRIATTTSLAGIKTQGGDFAAGALAKRLNTGERNELGLRAWRQYAKDTKTLGFCAGTQHAEDCAKLFNDAGIPAAAVYSGQRPTKKNPHSLYMRKAERDRRFDAFKKGEILVLFGDQLFVEGFDDPSVETALFFKRSKSAIYYQQALGRALRPSRDIARKLAVTENREDRLRLIADSQKPFARVIDLVDLNSNGVMELATLFAPQLHKGSRLSGPYEDTAQNDTVVAAGEGVGKSLGVHTVDRKDELGGQELIIEPFDVLEAERELVNADEKSPFVWYSDRPGQRRLQLPRMPIGVRADGSRSKAFEYAYAAAYSLPEDQRLARAREADPYAVVARQDTTLWIDADVSGRYRVYEEAVRAGHQPVERDLGVAESAQEAVAIAQRHIVDDYRHLIKLLDKLAPWRQQPTNRAQKEQLLALDLRPEDYESAGEAQDAIGAAMARAAADEARAS